MLVDDRPCTVAVLGASYGGFRAAQVLAAGLPSGWRVVLVERNSHFNHIYNFPRYAVLPGHEHKAFIPYDKLFGKSTPDTPHKCVHGTALSLHPRHLTYLPHSTASSESGPPEPCTLYFDYAIYALGSHLPAPIDLWRDRNKLGSKDLQEVSAMETTPVESNKRCYMGVKSQGIAWLQERQKRIHAARSVLVVGGGALGIQFASDIAELYPCTVTLLHSRKQLLSRFDSALGDEALSALQNLGVHVILGERLDFTSLDNGADAGDGITGVRTTSGMVLAADLVLLCTGQQPNTAIMRGMDKRTVDSKGLIRVTREMQVLVEPESLPQPDVDFDCVDRLYAGSTSTSCGVKHVSSEALNVKYSSSIHPGVQSQHGALSSVWCSPPSLASSRESNSPGSSIPCLQSSPLPSNDLHMVEEHETSVHENVPWTGPQSPKTLYPHIFAIGDAAAAFGALPAGHTAYHQAEVAARNVLRLVKRDGLERQRMASGKPVNTGVGVGDGSVEMEMVKGEEEELEEYNPGPPMIKVSLGLTHLAYEVAGVVGTSDDGTEDLGASTIWRACGLENVSEEEMWQ